MKVDAFTIQMFPHENVHWHCGSWFFVACPSHCMPLSFVFILRSECALRCQKLDVAPSSSHLPVFSLRVSLTPWQHIIASMALLRNGVMLPFIGCLTFISIIFLIRLRTQNYANWLFLLFFPPISFDWSISICRTNALSAFFVGLRSICNWFNAISTGFFFLLQHV